MSTNNPFDPESMMGPEWRDQAAEIGLSSMKNWNAENAAGLNIGAEMMKDTMSIEQFGLNTSAVAKQINEEYLKTPGHLAGFAELAQRLNVVSRDVQIFANGIPGLVSAIEANNRTLLDAMNGTQDLGIKISAAVEAITPKLRLEDLAGTSNAMRKMMEFYRLDSSSLVDAVRMAAASPLIMEGLRDYVEKHPETVSDVQESLRDDDEEEIGDESGTDDGATPSEGKRKVKWRRPDTSPQDATVAFLDLVETNWDRVSPVLGIPDEVLGPVNEAVNYLIGLLIFLISTGFIPFPERDSDEPGDDSGE